MGCASSKLEDLPAVALCRERCSFLDEAINQRYALAAAHMAYIDSLKSIAKSLHAFIQQDRDLGAPSPPPSPPPKTKHASPSHSDSGSHLHFHSDSDDLPSLHHSEHSSPLHLPSPYYDNSQTDHHLHMNYMKNKPTSSVVYEQRPMNPETMYVGESSSSSYQYQYPPNPYPYPSYPHDPYSYGSSSPHPPPPPAPAASKPPPPPPSPPRTSTWDFLNFFDNSDDRYYPQTHYTATPSRDSKEVREEEGIPDLEDEDYQHQQEVVKQVHGDQKLVDPKPDAHLSLDDDDDDDDDNEDEEDEELEYDVHVVDKKVVDKGKDGNKAAAFRPGSRNPLEVAQEIQLLFHRASDSGAQIAKILEVGKHPYNRKHAARKASQPSTSNDAESASTLDLDLDLTTRSRNLSTTLHKLLLWEKKLFNEVKAEEKMRVMHDRKCRKLKRLDNRGADFHKVDTTRALIRTLSTKIRMAIQVVDNISVTINKIRDEELWPQLKELIQGLARMWKSMLECHHNQCEAIREARILGSIGSRKKSGDGHLKATKDLEQELINWTFLFSGWISAQKGYVRALNSWLRKCLPDEQEETPDGIVPFSPGRMGAPQIFVICHQWSQDLDRISEKEVVESMHVFTMSVLQIWEQDKLEMHRQMMQNKDLEKYVRNIDRDDQKLQKQIQALGRKVVLVSGEGKGLSVSENIIYQSDKSSSLQASLQRIFEAMERFTDESVRVYEDLLQRSEEESAAQDHKRVS